jgi:hypothetical protein
LSGRLCRSTIFGTLMFFDALQHNEVFVTAISEQKLDGQDRGSSVLTFIWPIRTSTVRCSLRMARFEWSSS